MNPLSIPVALVGTVTAYIGLYHLWIHFRRANPADWYFALTCLVMTLFDVVSVIRYNINSLEAIFFWQRISILAILLLGPLFLLFVSSYTKIPVQRWVRITFSLFFVAILIAGVERWGWVLQPIPHEKHLSTFLGDFNVYEFRTGPLLPFLALGIPLTAAYILWISQKNARQIRSLPPGFSLVLPARQDVPLLIAASILLFGISHDTLVTITGLPRLYITEYSFLGVVILMSWSLSNEIVDASLTRQTLRETQALIATTLDSVHDAVITTDLEGKITHLNPAAERMLATPLAQAQNRKLAELVEITSTETLTQVPDPIRYAVGRPPNPYGRLPRMVTTDGSDRRVDLGGAPLLDERGKVQGAVVVFRDLTVQHNAIESLQHAKQMESMGQLAGGLAHDLNNLLTPILSYVDLLQRQMPTGSRNAVFLGHVQDAAQRAANLTRQLLALSRKQVLDVQVLNLSELVRQTLPIVRRLVPDTIEIVTEFDEREQLVQIDPGQFEQVLLNLITNARDAMPQGGRISLSTRSVSTHEICLGVEDQGAGIPPELIDRVFEPFFTTKPRGKGTGLGLAQVRGIVEQHGGSIYVDSELGEGTSFDIILPTFSGDVAPVSPRTLIPSEAARGNERVLVVEDDQAVRTLIHDALSQLGYNVRTADGLTTALAIASSEPLDLLLSDVVMPGADGPRVHAAVRQYHDIPCLFITGHADDRLGDRGFLPRGTEVLRKPFTVAELAEKVRLVLERSRISWSSAPPPPPASSPVSGPGPSDFN